jgi:major membrane immunogen (membrane-anchored lipoprotein)
MKKYLFYMMTVAAVLALGGCASNDEVIAETEDVQPAVTHTILARIDNSGNTRVALNGLKLNWQDGDQIGVVYQKTTGIETYIAAYTYKELTADESAALFTGTMTSDAKILYAYYPYNKGDGIINMEDVQVDISKNVGAGKVVVPMLGTLVDGEQPAFTFKAATALLAVKVKNLSSSNNFKHTSACLSNNSEIDLRGGTFSSTAYTAGTNSYDLVYDISKVSGTQTFYFPLPTGSKIEGLQFTLTGLAELERVKFADFTPVANTKYVKAIQLKEDGTRDKSALALANCKLEATNTVVADFEDEDTNNMEGEFRIPLNQEAGNDETVNLTLTNCYYEKASFVEGDSDFKDATTAKTVKIVNGESNDTKFVIDLPNSDVELDAWTQEVTAFEVNNAKSFKIDDNALVKDNAIINGNVSKIIIPDHDGVKSKSISLTVKSGSAIDEISLGKGVYLSINSGVTINVNGTSVTFGELEVSYDGTSLAFSGE